MFLRRAAPRGERTCTTIQAARLSKVTRHAWGWKTRGDTRFHIPRLRRWAARAVRRCTRTAGRTHRRETWRRVGALATMRLAARRATAHPRLVPWIADHGRSRDLLDQARRLRCFEAGRIRWAYRTWGGGLRARSGGGVRRSARRCGGDLGGLEGRGGAAAPPLFFFLPCCPHGRWALWAERTPSGVSSFLFRRCLRHYPITRDCPQRRTVRPPGLALRKQMPPRIVRVAHRY